MATDIVTTTDIETELGGSFSASDQAMLDSIRKRVESSVRRYCRWNITEATYTHILPGYAPVGERLQLEQPFVTSVTGVWEDRTSRGGQQDGDFPDGSELTAGTDFWLDYDSSGMSKEGILFRYGGNWPEFPRTVKVTYTSGFNAAALADEYLFVKEAIYNEVIARYKARKETQGSGGSPGPLKSEKLKDYSVSFSNTSERIASTSSGLLPETEGILDSIVFYGGWG